MPERIVVAYLLIVAILIAAAVGVNAWRRQVRAERRMRRGGRALERRDGWRK